MAVSALFGDVGTALTWRDSGGTYAATLTALATVAARVGARGDLGAWPHAITWRWYCETQWTSAPVTDGQLEIYLGGWDEDTPASPVGQLPATDTGYAAGAAGLSKRKNLTFLGGPIIETSAVGPFSAGGFVVLPYRYVSPMFYNNGSVGLAAVGTFPTVFRLTPVYPEAQ
jgi:hypothetical protein